MRLHGHLGCCGEKVECSLCVLFGSYEGKTC